MKNTRNSTTPNAREFKKRFPEKFKSICQDLKGNVYFSKIAIKYKVSTRMVRAIKSLIFSGTLKVVLLAENRI